MKPRHEPRPVAECPQCGKRYVRVSFHSFDREKKPLLHPCALWIHDDGRTCHGRCIDWISQAEAGK